MTTRTDRDTFLARAAEARAEAASATLDNVRDRCLRAEAAWTEMAERVERTERMRATLQAEKEQAATSASPSPPGWPSNIEISKPRLQQE